MKTCGVSMNGTAVAIAIVSLVLIGTGCYFAWPPAAGIVPGLLLWLDLSRKD